MTAETTCPICGFELGSARSDTCPQCDADLSCFAILDSLPDELEIKASRPAEPERSKRPIMTRPILGAGAAFCFAAGLFLGFLFTPVADRPNEALPLLSRPLGLPVRIKIPERPAGGPSSHGALESDALMASIQTGALDPSALSLWVLPWTAPETRKRPPEALRPGSERRDIPGASETVVSVDLAQTPDVQRGTDRDKEMQAEKPDASSQKPQTRQTVALPDEPQTEDSRTTEGDFRKYEVSEAETLWRMAQRVYGSGYYFPVIMEANPQIRVHDIRKGIRLNIYKDPGVAEELYRENVYFKDGKACYRYLVRPGDTFESIAVKFYGHRDMKGRILDFNPDGALHPGMRIGIALE